jgi:organic hydroperoxide reductase OsmC/OhrA
MHHFSAQIRWTGNTGSGTSGYRDYARDHVIAMEGKPDLLGSSAPVFRGDGARHNPEDLLVGALSACHMLWYLHFAAVNGVVVTGYEDDAVGVMETEADGNGRFVSVTLRPRVVIDSGSDAAKAQALHADAHHFCFISNSVNFPVHCEPTVVLASQADTHPSAWGAESLKKRAGRWSSARL